MKSIVLILCLVFSIVSKAQDNITPVRQGLFGLDLLSINGDFGLGIEAATLWNKDFGWTFAIRGKSAGAKASSVSYQTAKNTFGDSEKSTKYGLVGMSIGRTYGFNDNFFVSGAVGFDSYEKLVEFYDPTGILGSGGQYYVSKEKSTSFTATAKAYYSIPSSSWAVSAGYQTGLVGAFVGIAYAQ